MQDGQPPAEPGERPSGSDTSDAFLRKDPPHFSTTLWAPRSLSPRGAQAVILFCTLAFLVPLAPFLGTPVAWGLLPFMCAVLALTTWAFRRSWQNSELHEVLKLWPDLITVERHEPRGAVRRWQANPYWVEPRLHADARIESYLTLKGGGREIELGAFLSPDERVALFDRLTDELRAAQRSTL